MSARWMERVRAARASGDPSPLLECVPYAAFLGLSVELSGGELVGRLRFSDPLIGDSTIPALHGGTLGALLESTAHLAVLFGTDVEQIPKTINLTVEYLRSGRARDTFATAVITKPGRRVVNVRATAWQDDRSRPVAAANVHFLVG